MQNLSVGGNLGLASLRRFTKFLSISKSAEAPLLRHARATVPWYEERFSRAGITDAQSRDLEAIFQQVLPTLKTNKQDLDRKEKALAQLLNDANSPETLVVQTIDRVEAARSALSRTRTLMLYRMYRLLSAEQRVKGQAYQGRKALEGGGLSTRR